MGDRYKQVKLYDNFKFCPTYPVDILKGAIYIDNVTNKAVFQLKFVNTQYRNIKAVYITVVGYDELGKELENKEYSYLDLNVFTGQEFGTDQLKDLDNNTIRNIEITINKVIYADNEVWENKNAVAYDRTSLKEIDKDLLFIAKRKITKQGIQLDNMYYPTEDKYYWTCVCGTYNSNSNNRCYKCDCSKDIVFSNFSKYVIEQELQEYEDNRKKNNERIKSNTKKLIKVIGIIILVILISLLIFFIGRLIKQNLEYNQAIKDFESQNYIVALKEFKKLNNYKESNNYIKEINEIINKQEIEKFSKSTERVSKNASISSNYDYDYVDKKYKGHILAVKNDGTVIATGDNENGECNVSEWKNIIQVTAGKGFSVGLKSDGTVIAIGKNDEGQCNVSNWKNIIQISAGTTYCLGLKSDGTVVQAGNYSNEIDTSRWKDIVSISAGKFLCAGLKKDGTIVSSGSDLYNIKRIEEYNNVIQVSAGSCIVGLKNDGSVVRAGFNYRNGEQQEEEWKNIIQVSNGEYFSLGLKADGTVVATGKSENGECNVSSWKDIVYVYAGTGFSLGIKSDGSVVTSGKLKLPKDWENIKI